MIKRAAVLLTALLLCRCTPDILKATTRNPDLFEKEGASLLRSGQVPASQAVPEIYVRQPNLEIKPLESPNETGSLMNLDDERNYLFSSAGPHKVGRFVTIKVASNIKPKDKKTEELKKDKDTPKDDIEKDLLEAIPELQPAEPGETRLIDDFKMKIMHRYDNGDVMVTMTRRSVHGDQAEDMTVTARLPYDRLMAGDALSTDDLLDVRLVSSKDGELVESRSSGWEDEYSLRLSGFREAKSKVAQELDDKRKKLEQARENLQNRVKTFGKEREQVAKQRDEMNKERTMLEEQRKALETKLDEQRKSLDNANEALKSKEEQIAVLQQKEASKVDKPDATKEAN